METYAQDHDGRFPAGERSPEASLSLLYREQLTDPYTLAGKGVPREKAKTILESGGLLDPDTCGWHYVEGLTKADDPRLAILWDKNRLGHNGQRTKDGGCEVVTVGNGREYISAEKWAAFMAEQEQLLRNRSERQKRGLPLIAATIELPDGSRINEVRGPYKMKEKTEWEDSSGDGSSSGSALTSYDLLWFNAPENVKAITRTLSFSNLTSQPITVRFSNGIPDLTNVVFKMRPSL